MLGRKIWRLVASFVILFLALPHTPLAEKAFAAEGIRQTINFQGKVVNSNGTNVSNGSYDFTFTIFDASSGGTNLWDETWNSGTSQVTVTDGTFQVELGTHDTSLGNLDFNSDVLYLAVNFNGDGNMTPRIRMTSVPYAFNAKKVAGLTVQDSSGGPNTTGTLKVADGATLTFVADFTVSGANALTLTTTGATNVTLPTTGTLVTLAGSEQLTNKTIGSTGLTFSGATTDITTAGGEALVINGNAASTIQTSAGEIILQAAGTGTTSRIQIGAGGVGSTTPDFLALDVKSDTGDPAGGAEGYMYYNTADNVFRCYQNTGWTDCIGSGVGGGTLAQAYASDANGSDATITLSADDDSIIIDNPSSSGSDSAFTFKISQSNTTAAVSVLDLVQSSNNANAVNLTANSIDTETGIAITANALTSGKGLTLASSSTAFTGNLAEITLSGSNAANTGSLLKLSNTGTANTNTSFYIDHRATGTNNFAMRVDDTSGDTTPFIIDGDGRVGIGTTSISGSTERMLQVGSQTERGNLAVYGDVVSQGYSDITALTNIQDIYLYDTTSDSDGGKWIDWATTDQLSWYTEALDDSPSDPCNISTDDRCYTSQFPRKALIVATLDDVYIFDASTNDMWMKFSQHSSSYALGIATNNDISSVTALNGVIYVTTNGSANTGMYVIDFVNDRMWNIDGTDRSGADKGISERNTAITYNSDNLTAFDLSVSGTAAEWEDLNDVSAVYISGSSTAIAIGAATNTSPGSGQTFVGLATDSGITVINMTVGKVIQYSDVTADDYTAVALTRRARLYALNTTTDQVEMWINFDTDKASEINGTFDARYDETVGPALWTSTPNILTDAPDALEVIERGSNADDTSDILYVGHSLGMTEIHTHATSTNGWSKFFSTTRQTMFMPAAIDMALMMDDPSGTRAEDISFNNTDMTLVNSPTLGASGVRGKAMTFNGSSQYMCSDADQNGVCDVDASFNMSTTGWTLSLWFKHSTSITGTDMLFEKCVTATPAQATGCVAAYMTSTGTIQAAIDDDAVWTQGSSYDITATSTLTYNDNQWHQLTLSRTNANDMDVYIDGNPLNLSTATGLTTTVDGTQIVTIGGSCNTAAGANCAAANATNFWDGSIDDVVFTAGASTVAQFSALQARRFYNDARPLVGKRIITVSDADVFSTTTIGDTAEAWIPNEFAGLFVTISGGTGAGQTRRIVGNTTTTITVSRAFSTTPDSTSDFTVDPESLQGSAAEVYAIGITGENPLGQARQMCVGTNNGSDAGAVTCYNHQAGPNVVADVFHGDTEQVDNYGAEWTGTDYDDIRSIDFGAKSLVIGSQAHMYTETETIRLGQGLDYIASQLFNIRAEMINDGITLTGSQALEVGFTGGADLAEWYYSNEELQPGDIVAIDPTLPNGVKRATKPYQEDVIGIVATEPGLILGTHAENAYPIALVGRVPVRVSIDNGLIQAGDYITSSTITGVGTKALQAGTVLGKALHDMDPGTLELCPDSIDLQCGVVNVFVNLSKTHGVSIAELVLEEDGISDIQYNDSSFALHTYATQENQRILAYLRTLATQKSPESGFSSIFTDKIHSSEVVAPSIITDLLVAKRIRADSIEGLEIVTERITMLEKQLTDSNTPASDDVAIASDSAIIASTPQLQNIQLDADGLHVDSDAQIKGHVSIWGGSLIDGVVTILQSLTAKNLLVGDWSDFAGQSIFRDSVYFLGSPEFNSDTAGIIRIPKGSDRVNVAFKQEYRTIPIINLTPSLENDDPNDELKDVFFQEQFRFVVSKRTTKGFTIILNKQAEQDIDFAWTAIAVSGIQSQPATESVRDARVFESIPASTSAIPLEDTSPDMALSQ